MSAYTWVSLRFPWFIKSAFGHWIFWQMVYIRRHIEVTQKAFEDLTK